ncbi:MAG: HNH endonuclease [Desulfobulbaceae bacterium]|nr:HNH endonuclease [Desulfobulbaceae bacterium]
MCGRLDDFLNTFAKLRTDGSKKNWTSLSYYRSPYKPLLLLAVLDFIETGIIVRNFIEPSFELAQTFQNYCALLLPPERKASMSYPFYHLESAAFWNLKPQPGQRHQKGLAVSSVKRLRQLYLGAQFSSDLFPLLQVPGSREKLRMVLIEKYFTPEIRQTIHEHSILSCQSYLYSSSLLTTQELPPDFKLTSNQTVHGDKVRDQGFRKAVVKLYDHRCALCGIKMLTPEGHTIVDAAHIMPWSVSHNDNPTNGIALCKTCHWSYDEGLMSVDQNYQVMISPAVKNDPNLPGHMLTLSDRPMFKPPESRFWPDQDNLAWHRRERFTKR